MNFARFFSICTVLGEVTLALILVALLAGMYDAIIRRIDSRTNR